MQVSIQKEAQCGARMPWHYLQVVGHFLVIVPVTTYYYAVVAGPVYTMNNNILKAIHFVFMAILAVSTGWIELTDPGTYGRYRIQEEAAEHVPGFRPDCPDFPKYFCPSGCKAWYARGRRKHCWKCNQCTT